MCVCSQVWECLGETYFARGSYDAAMKSFTRALEVCVCMRACVSACAITAFYTSLAFAIVHLPVIPVSTLLYCTIGILVVN